ncbi:FAD-binding and (Fe-S)-binding domain-containing protein [Arthrobacter sp. V1I9]|uniref:FAD-binding and (Fe-S)-binding domain-containing protein n=1 Tax=Arthrobacter sp. V1I9 TaxID=3042275 RepID=UPI0027D76D20|nr:FAD-binding and (Fe-S)-binding domain-containing protein [Arthrobacter sp. V1I9]
MSSDITEALVRDLKGAGIEVDSSSRRRTEYSFDASNYRVRPQAVAFPRSSHDVRSIIRVCRLHGCPVTSRGGGTSMAGNAIGTGLVMDFSRYMNRLLELDLESRTVTVEPGIILTTLQKEIQAATGGTYTFAPDPSSMGRVTVAGAIGNDACGNHSVRDGRTADHIVSVDLVTASGHLVTAEAGGVRALDPSDAESAAEAARIQEGLKHLADSNLAVFRTEFGRLARQVSGYQLANLLPENGFDTAKALAGSEGTCAVIVSATVKLAKVAPSALLVCLGYPDVVAAASDVPEILRFNPAAVEGIDDAIVQTVRHRRGDAAVGALPKGNAYLYVDLDGENPEDVRRQAENLLQSLAERGNLLEGLAVPDPSDRANLWRVREDGAGLSSRLADGEQSWAGWEDAAVSPENLAAYLSDFTALLEEHQLRGVMYGHFGAGCTHVRITFDPRSASGRDVMERFLREAAALVSRHGGSLSGEHGDGRARSELLPIMYSPAAITAFTHYKAIWDPHELLNPGIITKPAPIMSDLALAGAPARGFRTSFALEPTLKGREGFPDAVQSCIGVGRCRTTAGAGVMCPSYRATRDEKDSTRARARVLQEMVMGSRTAQEGWKSKDVRESLDLCLSCKACSSDCPAGVDMASYKSEFFHHFYQRRLRPLSHYSLGWLPTWLKVTGRIAPLINMTLRSPLAGVIARAAGITTKRKMPDFASRGQLEREIGTARPTDADTVLFVDSFTRGFRPAVAGAAKRVLEDAQKSVECSADQCCGLTWISTGQLDTARKLLRKTAAALDDGTDRPIVVIEPSCAAALRKDLPELVPTESARRVASRIQNFAGAVLEQANAGWRPQTIPTAVTVQTHCHEYATFGSASQTSALAALGVSSINQATGCCGVAGNFGFEHQHFDVSMAVAEQSLVPALRETSEGTPILTDGFSCHMQVRQILENHTDQASRHLAEIIDPGPAHHRQ